MRSRRAFAVLGAVALVALTLTSAPLAANAAPPLTTNPVDHVDTLNGTGTGGATVGSINNFPGAAVPFGMVQYSPDTAGNYAGYHYDNDRSTGFSMNHASAGCNVFGDIPMLPTTSPIGSSPWNAAERIAHDDTEVGQPGYYSVRFPDTGVTAELSATTRTGFGRFSFPDNGKPALFHVRSAGSLAGNSAATITIGDDNRTITGSATTGRFCGKNNTYTVYFAMEFNQPFTAFGTWDGASVSAGSRTADSNRSGGYVEFPAGAALEVKTSLSYVSVDGADSNLVNEGAISFDEARTAASESWNAALSRIAVAGTNTDDLELFYTSLYRSLLHPNTFNDADGRYIGFDSAIHTVSDGHTQFANFSDWDTYRSLAPLQALLFPTEASDMAQSLVNDAEQSGSYPRWALANSATGQMTGDNVVPLIANLHAFGAKDFDVETALRYMVKAATDGGAGLNGYVERPGIATYLERGYAPQVEDFRGDHRIVGASITMEWAVDDFAISRFADALGEAATTEEYQGRSNSWQNLFNPTTGYIAPRSAAGAFPSATSETTSGFGQDGFDEGNSAQYTWWVPQNIDGLVTALGGRQAVGERLDDFVTELNAGDSVPHLWAGNEPGFGIPWLYNAIGQPWKTQETVDRVRTELFAPTPNGEPGNDDLGAMSSWYVWAALGLYPTTPGTSVLSVNTPLFDQAEISIPGGKRITISAPDASNGDLPYIQGLSIDGQATENTWLPESIVTTGGNVSFSLSATPEPTWGTAESSAPPSFGEGSSAVTMNASPAVVSATPGSRGSVTVDVQRMEAEVTDYSISASSPQPGVTAGTISGTLDGQGFSSKLISVQVAPLVPDGYYPLTLTVSAGERTRTQTVIVSVAREGGLTAAFNVVGTAYEANTGVANFDSAGNSYSREQLAANGLTPGAPVAVGDTTFQWPSSPEAVPDAVIPKGQTVAIPNAPTLLSFVGASRDGGSEALATVTFDDGTTAAVPVGLGDWVLPSNSGAPVYNNSIVAKMAERNAHSDVHGAYVYATAPYAAPAGRTIASVTLPEQDRMRLFAIATNGVTPKPAEATVTISTSLEKPVAGVAFDLLATLTPVESAGTVTFFEGETNLGQVEVGSDATRAAGVDAVLPVTAPAAGTYEYTAHFTPTDSNAFTPSVSEPISVTVVPASVAPEPTTIPTAPATTGGDKPTSTGAGGLALTGAVVLPLVLIAGLSTVVGSAVLIARRRRTAMAPHEDGE